MEYCCCSDLKGDVRKALFSEKCALQTFLKHFSLQRLNLGVTYFSLDRRKSRSKCAQSEKDMRRATEKKEKEERERAEMR